MASLYMLNMMEKNYVSYIYEMSPHTGPNTMTVSLLEAEQMRPFSRFKTT